MVGVRGCSPGGLSICTLASKRMTGVLRETEQCIIHFAESISWYASSRKPSLEGAASSGGLGSKSHAPVPQIEEGTRFLFLIIFQITKTEISLQALEIYCSICFFMRLVKDHCPSCNPYSSWIGWVGGYCGHRHNQKARLQRYLPLAPFQEPTRCNPHPPATNSTFSHLYLCTIFSREFFFPSMGHLSTGI